MEQRPPPWFAPVAVAAMAFVGVAAVLMAYTIATGSDDEDPAPASASPVATVRPTGTAPATPATPTPTPRTRPRGTATPTATAGPNVACSLLPQAEVEAAFGFKLRADRDNQIAGEPCTYRATGVDRAIGASLRVLGSARDARNLLAIKDWELREVPGTGTEAYAISDTAGSYTVIMIKGDEAVQLDVFDKAHADLWSVMAGLAVKVGRRL